MNPHVAHVRSHECEPLLRHIRWAAIPAEMPGPGPCRIPGWVHHLNRSGVEDRRRPMFETRGQSVRILDDRPVLMYLDGKARNQW